jgi:hypothetical protein
MTAAARKPVASEGDKRPALMAALGVIAWLQLPRAINRLDMQQGSAEGRVKACIYEHTLGEYGHLTQVVEDSHGKKLAVAMHLETHRDGTARLRFLNQADIAKETGLDRAVVCRVIKKLEADGRIRLLPPHGRRIALVPEPEASPSSYTGEEKANGCCVYTNTLWRLNVTDPLFSKEYADTLRRWAEEEYVRFQQEHNAKRAQFLRDWRREDEEFCRALGAEVQAKLNELRAQLGLPPYDPATQQELTTAGKTPAAEAAADLHTKQPFSFSSPERSSQVSETAELTNSAVVYTQQAFAFSSPVDDPSSPAAAVETLDGFDDALTAAFDDRGKPIPTRAQVERVFEALPPGSRDAYLIDLTQPSNGQKARIDRMAHPGALKADVQEFVKRRWPRLKEKLEEARRKQMEWEARQAAEEARLAEEIAARPPNQREDWEEQFLRDYRKRHRHGPPKTRAAGGSG